MLSEILCCAITRILVISYKSLSRKCRFLFEPRGHLLERLLTGSKVQYSALTRKKICCGLIHTKCLIIELANVSPVGLIQILHFSTCFSCAARLHSPPSTLTLAASSNSLGMCNVHITRVAKPALCMRRIS